MQGLPRRPLLVFGKTAGNLARPRLGRLFLAARLGSTEVTHDEAQGPANRRIRSHVSAEACGACIDLQLRRDGPVYDDHRRRSSGGTGRRAAVELRLEDRLNSGHYRGEVV